MVLDHPVKRALAGATLAKYALKIEASDAFGKKRLVAIRLAEFHPLTAYIRATLWSRALTKPMSPVKLGL